MFQALEHRQPGRLSATKMKTVGRVWPTQGGERAFVSRTPLLETSAAVCRQTERGLWVWSGLGESSPVGGHQAQGPPLLTPWQRAGIPPQGHRAWHPREMQPALSRSTGAFLGVLFLGDRARGDFLFSKFYLKLPESVTSSSLGHWPVGPQPAGRTACAEEEVGEWKGDRIL